MSADLVVMPEEQGYQQLTVDQAIDRQAMLREFTQRCMINGTDYGTIPGTGKPTLYKPGAEKLCTLFGMSADLELVERVMDWTGKDTGGKPLFMFHYRYALYKGDRLICKADGIASSAERAHSRKDPVEIVNTVCKMAQKRALVAAVLIGVNASQFYTQDMEDTVPAVAETPKSVPDPITLKQKFKEAADSYGYTGKLGLLLKQLTGGTDNECLRAALLLRNADWKAAIKALQTDEDWDADMEFHSHLTQQTEDMWVKAGLAPTATLILDVIGDPYADGIVAGWFRPDQSLMWHKLTDEQLVMAQHYATTRKVWESGAEGAEVYLTAYRAVWSEQNPPPTRSATRTAATGGTQPTSAVSEGGTPPSAGPPATTSGRSNSPQTAANAA